MGTQEPKIRAVMVSEQMILFSTLIAILYTITGI